MSDRLFLAFQLAEPNQQKGKKMNKSKHVAINATRNLEKSKGNTKRRRRGRGEESS